jgi:hypothetical protein
MLAFDFGSLPLVASDNAAAAVESVIPLIDAESGYFARLAAVIGDTTASVASRGVAVVQLLFGSEAVGLITRGSPPMALCSSLAAWRRSLSTAPMS